MEPKRTSKTLAIADCRCPRCRQGRMFRSKAIDLSAFAKMQTACPACGQDFLIEPGFYMGASYIHYGFTAVVTAACVLADLALGQKVPTWMLIAGTLCANAILFPLGFRYARVLMLHWFGSIRYEPTLAHNQRVLFVDRRGQLHEDGESSGFYTGHSTDFS